MPFSILFLSLSHSQILDEFTPPPHFGPDLFRLLGEVRRPPYRWLLIGPPRSGSALHTDPLATAAWNTCVDGVKRWALFPPGTPRSAVKGAHLVDPQWLARLRGSGPPSTAAGVTADPAQPTSDEVDEAMEGVHYFMHSLPMLRRQWASDRAAAAAASGSGASSDAAAATSAAGADVSPSDTSAADFAAGFTGSSSSVGVEESPFGLVEFLQYPGETVFVPGGWLHAVVNLVPTAAVTQNYVSGTNLPQAWEETRVKRPHMARRWREQMSRHEPLLLAEHMALSPSPPLQGQGQAPGDIDADQSASAGESDADEPCPGSSRRPDVDFEAASLDPDSWYWNPSSSSSEDDEDEDDEGQGEGKGRGDDSYQ